MMPSPFVETVRKVGRVRFFGQFLSVFHRFIETDSTLSKVFLLQNIVQYFT